MNSSNYKPEHHPESGIIGVLERRNGRYNATRLMLLNYYGAGLSPQDKDELLVCSRIVKERGE